jgi:hypothetical protein
MPAIELAICSETKATIAKESITTTTGHPLLNTVQKGRSTSKLKASIVSKIREERGKWCQ